MSTYVNLNKSSELGLKGDNYQSLFAWQNICLENLKNIILIAATNKKTSDQQKNINDLMFIMAEVIVMMEKFQIKITQEFYLKEAKEKSEILEKQYIEGKRVQDELNRLYEVYIVTNELAAKKMQEEYLKVRSELVENKSNLEQLLNVSEDKISNLKENIENTVRDIKTNFKSVSNDVIEKYFPNNFHINEKIFKIDREELEEAINNEFEDDLNNGNLKFEDITSKVENALRTLLIKKLNEENIKVDPSILGQMEIFLEKETNIFMELFHKHKDANKILEDIDKRKVFESDLQDEIKNKDGILNKIARIDRSIFNLDQADNAVKSAKTEETIESARQAFIDTIQTERNVAENIDSIIERETSEKTQNIDEKLNPDEEDNDEDEDMDFSTIGGEIDAHSLDATENQNDDSQNNDDNDYNNPPPDDALSEPPNNYISPSYPRDDQGGGIGQTISPPGGASLPSNVVASAVANDTPPGGAPLQFDRPDIQPPQPQKIDSTPEPSIVNEDKSVKTSVEQPKTSSSTIFQKLGISQAQVAAMTKEKSKNNIDENKISKNESNLEQKKQPEFPNVNVDEEQREDIHNKPRAPGR